MSNSVAGDDPVLGLSPGAVRPMGRRKGRRKLVQSTLFPHRPQERDCIGDQKDKKHLIEVEHGEDNEDCSGSQSKKRKLKGKASPQTKGPKKDDKDFREDEHREDIEDCSGSQGKKKNKPKGKASPQTKGPKKRDKRNSTPKKNVRGNGLQGACSGQISPDSIKIGDASPPVPDLRLEARLSAEENSRMFAGRKIHPFFSSLKAGKKIQDITEAEDSWYSVERKDREISCGPIHIFERTLDDATPLDWSNWTFFEDTINRHCSLDSSFSSVSEGSIEALNFDKHPSLLNPSNASIPQTGVSCSDHCLKQPQNLHVISPAISAVPDTEQVTCYQTHEVDLVADNGDLFSGQTGCLVKSDAEQQSRFLQERMMSNYHSCENEPEGSLWTYKYKPTKAMEVCGNDESVKFLSDWLHLWHERGFRSRKETTEKRCSLQEVDDGDSDDDYSSPHSDADSENIYEEDNLRNVLLLTGPIGSGKSAAVYACAQEQGFEVLELSASDCRNGTTVKQKFGEVFESRRLKRSLEHPKGSQNKKIMKLPPSLSNGEAGDELDDEMIELIALSDEEAPGKTTEASGRFVLKKNVITCDKGEVQRLILVEDVDILFPEDRGFVAAIHQIAETAKGPIILTSNSSSPVLPENLRRLHVCFSLPSSKELFCHLQMVCATERVNIQPHLLERFILSCHGDIRKTITLLQFWFQSKTFIQDSKVQGMYGSLPFDLEAGHQLLPKVIPWGFPSQLSDLIEKEIAKSVTMMEENSSFLDVVDEEFLHINEMQNDLYMHHNGPGNLEVKKIEMLKRNGSIHDCIELDTQFDTAPEFFNDSGTAVACSRRNVRRKLVVMSSDSEDEALDNGHPIDISKCSNAVSHEVNARFPSDFQNCSSSLSSKLLCSGLKEPDEKHCEYSETADDECLNETCKAFDISCVPESSFVPETEIENGTELLSKTISCGHLSGFLDDFSVNNELIPVAFSGWQPVTRVQETSDLVLNNCAEIPELSQGETIAFSECQPLTRVQETSDMVLNHCAEIPELSQGDTMQDFENEHVEATTRMYNVMDECSRVNFKLTSILVDGSSSSVESLETDMVQKTWKRLHDFRKDLRQFAAPEHLSALQILKHAHGMSNLISEADMLLSRCGQEIYDILKPPVISCDNAAFNLYNMQMMSTIAVHGFCFYAKRITALGSTMGCETNVDLALEMLASTTDVMALGKLSRHEMEKSWTPHAGKDIEMNQPTNDLPLSEIKPCVFNVIQSVVPARSFLAVKGIAFCEYLSSLRKISRSEASRLSKGIETTRKRRGRTARHYLSTGNLMLSPEDISLLCEFGFHEKISL
ncbi:ATPase family AAA domain-containing protein 5 [Quillaja saponaria]|uniref:ATPase family AAA domain-containing protein 5 n=1 Tax=Quillaja saponaria TaxID=32244 RepID=A0AAD7PLI7_QUISA|nr:ATPase family AAA domain-containing protein 5 [Quillaja saponaria]